MSLENIRGVIRKIDYTLTEDEIDDWCEACRYAIQTETYDFSSFSREVYSQSGKKRVIYSFPKLSVENMLSHYLKQQLDRAFHIKYASRSKIINLLFNTLVATKNMNDFVIVRADFKSFFDSVKSEYVYEKYILPSIIKREDKQLLEKYVENFKYCYEHIFLLSKEKKYYYDAAAIAEPLAPTTAERYRRARSTNSKYTQEIPGQGKVQGLNRPRDGGYYDDALMPTTRNKRDVWLINTVPYKGAHFAAFPPKLAETCILAGCPKGGIVIDPFFGSGTTGFAAKSLDRHYIGIELNAEYCALARARIGGAGLSSN